MLIVNLYGAPGAGKSTGAAYIFAKLKSAGINAELVTEFAKDKVWEENPSVFRNQVYILGKQSFRISRLEGKVDVVVTDSPILLSSYYNSDADIQHELDALVTKVASKYRALNVFIDRHKPYNPAGRFQTEAESDNIAASLKEFLAIHCVPVKHYPGTFDGYDRLVEDILAELHSKDTESL